MKKAITTLALALIALSPVAHGTPIPIPLWDQPNLDPAIKTAPSGDTIVADLTSAAFVASPEFEPANSGGYHFYSEGGAPAVTWSETFGIGEAYGPVVRSGQAFYEPEAIQFNTLAPIDGMWMHDDAFLNIGSASPYPALTFDLAGG